MDYYVKHKNSIKNIILEKNYRSSQEILDVAKSSIEFNTERISTEI
jgi:superfamily I DNA/RNA helicase